MYCDRSNLCEFYSCPKWRNAVRCVTWTPLRHISDDISKPWIQSVALVTLLQGFQKQFIPPWFLVKLESSSGCLPCYHGLPLFTMASCASTSTITLWIQGQVSQILLRSGVDSKWECFAEPIFEGCQFFAKGRFTSFQVPLQVRFWRFDV